MAYVGDATALRQVSNSHLRSSFLKKGGTVLRYCIWGQTELTVQTVHSRLSAILRDDESILKLHRVFQPNGRLRFDLYVGVDLPVQGSGVRGLNTAKTTTSPVDNEGRKTRVMDFVRRVSRCDGSSFYCREHRPYVARVASDTEVDSVKENVQRQPAAPKAELVSGRVYAMTFNVCRNRNKELLTTMCRTRKLHILAIQETGRTASQWPIRLPGYTVMESLASDDRGCNGVALAIHKTLSCYIVGESSPFWVIARVFGFAGTNPVLVVSVYIPSSSWRSTWSSLKTQIKSLQRKFPEDSLVILGDFNKAPAYIGDRVKPLDLALLQVSGSDLSFHRQGTGVSSLDHVVVSSGVKGWTKVDRTWPLSDHWPVWSKIELPSIVTDTQGVGANGVVSFRRDWRTAPPQQSPSPTNAIKEEWQVWRSRYRVRDASWLRNKDQVVAFANSPAWSNRFSALLPECSEEDSDDSDQVSSRETDDRASPSTITSKLNEVTESLVRTFHEVATSEKAALPRVQAGQRERLPKGILRKLFKARRLQTKLHEVGPGMEASRRSRLVEEAEQTKIRVKKAIAKWRFKRQAHRRKIHALQLVADPAKHWQGTRQTI